MQSLGLQIFSVQTIQVQGVSVWRRSLAVPARSVMQFLPHPDVHLSALKPWTTPAGSQKRAHLKLRPQLPCELKGATPKDCPLRKSRVTGKSKETRGEKSGSTVDILTNGAPHTSQPSISLWILNKCQVLSSYLSTIWTLNLLWRYNKLWKSLQVTGGFISGHLTYWDSQTLIDINDRCIHQLHKRTMKMPQL